MNIGSSKHQEQSVEDTLELINEFLKSLVTSDYTVFHSQLLES